MVSLLYFPVRLWFRKAASCLRTKRKIIAPRGKEKTALLYRRGGEMQKYRQERGDVGGDRLQAGIHGGERALEPPPTTYAKALPRGIHYAKSAIRE